MNIKNFTLSTALVALSLSAFAADTFYVSTTGADEAARSGGESEPFATVNYALSRVSAYSTVLIEDGTYPLAETIQFGSAVPSGVTIRSKSGDRSKVVLDGGGVRRCIYSLSNEGGMVADLTISNGWSAVVSEVGGVRGGGVYSYQGCGLTNCVVTCCSCVSVDEAAWGGGVYIEKSLGGIVDSLVENCVASNNFVSGASFAARGGGVYAWNSPVRRCEIRFCKVWNNSTSSAFSACAGGGMYLKSDAFVSHCHLHHNVAENGRGGNSSYHGCGAGAFLEDSSIEDCLVENNVAAGLGGGVLMNGPTVYGGGIMLDGCQGMEILDAVIRRNQSVNGGGLAISKRLANKMNGNIVISNCVFEANFANREGGVMRLDGTSDLMVRDCWALENGNKSAWGVAVNGTSPSQRTLGVTFRNCLFRGNSGPHNGLLTNTAVFPMALEYCTFVDNQADLATVCPGSAAAAAVTTVKGCVFNDLNKKTGGCWPVFYSTFADYGANITYCSSNYADNYPAGQNGNLTAGTDVKFTDSAADNFRPLPASPLKAAGDAAEAWMSGAKDLGQGDPLLKPVGTYGVSVVRVKAKDRLLNGKPTIGCSEAWAPGGLSISIR